MGRSIKNKCGRKCRNVNRQHFLKKEMERLYKCVAIGEKELTEHVKWASKKKLTNTDEKPDIKEEDLDSVTGTDTQEDGTMDIDKTAPVYDKQTKRDENGHYPPWMNKKAVKNLKKRLGNTKQKGKPKGKSRPIKW